MKVMPVVLSPTQGGSRYRERARLGVEDLRWLELLANGFATWILLSQRSSPHYVRYRFGSRLLANEPVRAVDWDALDQWMCGTAAFMQQ